MGEKNCSTAVIANAWDHRSDAYSSVAALASILGARLAFEYLDPLAGLVVSALIIKMSLSLFRSNIGILMDERPEAMVLDNIRAVTLKVEGIEAIDDLRAHRHASSLCIDLKIAVDNSLTVEQGHQVAHEVKRRLLSEVEQVKGCHGSH